MKPKALFLSHRVPYPPDKGDKIRAWHLLKFISEQYDVSLGCFVDDPADLRYRDHLETCCETVFFRELTPATAKLKALSGFLTGEPLSIRYYRDHAMAKWVQDQRSGGLAVEVAFSAPMATYLKEGATTLVDLADADSAKWSEYGQSGGLFSRLLHRREGRLLAKQEGRIARKAGRTFLVSPEEAAIIRGHPEVPAVKVDWFRNGVDTDYWRADSQFDRSSHQFDLLFTGVMDYRPNVEAVEWFVKAVWPQLRKTLPTLTFGIVGRRPAPLIQTLGKVPGVTVTGGVDDVRPYLAAATLAVAPLRIARGVQNKVLEAMAMGVPVIASTGAVTGTGAVPGEHLIVADTAAETVEAITLLLRQPVEAARLGAAAANFIQQNGRWEQALDRFAAALPSDTV